MQARAFVCSSESRQRMKDLLNQVKECTIVLGSPEAVLDTHRAILRYPELWGRFASVAVDEGHTRLTDIHSFCGLHSLTAAAALHVSSCIRNWFMRN